MSGTFEKAHAEAIEKAGDLRFSGLTSDEAYEAYKAILWNYGFTPGDVPNKEEFYEQSQIQEAVDFQNSSVDVDWFAQQHLDKFRERVALAGLERKEEEELGNWLKD
jgi:hypothetical protein